MTLARVKETGSGSLEYRLVIEGLPYEAVSHTDMERRFPQVRGESGWSASNYYSRADGVLEGGSTMVRAVMFRLDSTPGGTQYIFSKGTAGTTNGGWSFSIDASRNLDWRVSDGVSSYEVTHTFGADDVGKTHVVVGVLGSSTVQLWVNGTSVGTTGSASLTPNSSPTNIGSRDNGVNPFTAGTIVACAASDSVATVGDADTYWEACKAAGDLASFTGIESLWSVSSSGNMIRDRVGSVTMTLNGSLTAEGPFSADYDDEDGRERVAGLKRDGLVLEERVIIPEADIEVGSMSVAIVDSQHDTAWTKAFAYQPSVVTYLTSDAGVAATSLSVASTSGLSAGDVIHIGTEAIKVGTVASSTSLTGCSRSQWDTIAQKHWTRDDAAHIAYPAVTNRPTDIERRRAYLYVYGDGDSKQGDGTLRWTGVCLTDAELEGDGTTWSLTIDSIMQLYDQDFGGDLKAPVPPRGIYYPANAPLIIHVTEYNSAAEAAGTTVANEGEFRIVGFYETQEDFLSDVNTEFDTLISGWNVDLIRAVGGRDGWEIQFRTGSTARWLEFQISSLIDKQTNAMGAAIRLDSSDEQKRTVASNTDYYVDPLDPAVPGAGTVPRGVYGRDASTYGAGLATDADLAASPSNRIHLGGTVTVDSTLTPSIEVPDGASSFEGKFTPRVNTVDGTSRYIDFRDHILPGSGAVSFVYTAALLPTVHFTRTYARGGLADLIQGITDLSQTDANKGTVPFVVAGTDVENFAAYSATIVAAEAGHTWTQRRWVAGPDEINLKKLLQNECKIRGLFMRLDSQGRVSFSSLTTPVPSALSSYTADEGELLSVSGWPSWSKNAQGLINTVLVRTGYNAEEGEFQGVPVRVRDVTSISRFKASKMLEIGAESESKYATLPTYEDIEDLVQPVFAIWGGNYAVISVEVPFVFFDALCGDILTLTCSTLPDPETGKRGVTDRAALIVGRRWNLDDCYGTLDLLASYEKFGGYAPSVSVTSASGSGTAWTLTVSTASPDGLSGYFPTGGALSDFFADGFKIKLRQWNSASPTIRTGTIDASGVDDTASTIAVTLDSSWGGLSGNDYVLGFGDAGDVVSDQQVYVFLADTDLRVAFSTSAQAFKYAS